MLKKRLYWVLLLALLGFASCGSDEEIGSVERVDLIDFDFPQGSNPWDKEIEQIAKDWGMYIIYKGVDSTHLNKTWTSPVYSDPVYVCTEPSAEDVPLYVGLIKEWLLGNLDKNREEDKKQLPFYLYIVNDLNDGNPRSPTYQKNHVQIKKDGLDYWSLSFTSEELAAGLTQEIIHAVACEFSYPGLKVRFQTGEYKIAPEFASFSDYRSPIGVRYYSLEQFMKDNPWADDEIYYEWMVPPCERDPDNIYTYKGFAPQIGEDFKPVEVVHGYIKTYGAPTWMPWIPNVFEDENGKPMEEEASPGPIPSDIEQRVLLDFLNMIRFAMIYTEEDIRGKYPVNAENFLEREGNQKINGKYDLVVRYMREIYRVDLPKYAAILAQK